MRLVSMTKEIGVPLGRSGRVMRPKARRVDVVEAIGVMRPQAGRVDVVRLRWSALHTRGRCVCPLDGGADEQ